MTAAGGDRLTDEAFAQVLASTPLVSIDLLVADDDGRLLVGRRRNRPAAGTLFVPGGRIWKSDTSLDAALSRIARVELGVAGGLVWEQRRLAGAYMHVYPDNALDEPGISTHYVVLAYRLEARDVGLDPHVFASQHSEVRWVRRGDENLDDVHPNTLVYLDL